jgi:hypothetical protein
MTRRAIEVPKGAPPKAIPLALLGKQSGSVENGEDFAGQEKCVGEPRGSSPWYQ